MYTVRPFCRLICVPLVLAMASCGFPLLQQGEPDFNTAILLPGAATATLSTTTPAVIPAQTEPTRSPGMHGLVPSFAPASCAAPLNAAVSQDQVKQCVYEVKALIDDHYREYRITLHHFVDDGAAAFDIGSLGLNAVGTLVGATGVKTTMSALAGALTGTKSIVNEDVLMKTAIEVVINQMDTDRQTQFNVMLGEMQGGNYTLAQAKDDLLIYFGDGTFDHALVSLQTQTAAIGAACKAATDQAKVNASQTTTATPSTSTSNSANGCQPTATSPSGPQVVKFSGLAAALTAPNPTLSIKVIAIVAASDNSVVIALSVPAANVLSVTVEGAPAVPPSNSVTLTKQQLSTGSKTVTFNLQNLAAPSTIAVTANGQTTGLQTLGSVPVQ